MHWNISFMVDPRIILTKVSLTLWQIGICHTVAKLSKLTTRLGRKIKSSFFFPIVHLLSNFRTNKDFTCYKLDIACNKGLNMLLPVYIDHILYPLLNVSLNLMNEKQPVTFL